MQPSLGESAGGAAPRRHTERIALGVLMGLAFLVVAWMAAPLLVGLALGTVLGFTAQPLQLRLERTWRGRRKLAAAVTTLLGGMVMAGGGAFAVWTVAREIVAAITWVQELMSPGGPRLLGPRAVRWLALLGVRREVVEQRLRAELGHFANLAARATGIVVQASFGVVLTLLVALWTMHYVLLDWPRIARHLERLLPLDPRHTRALVDEFRHVGRTAFVGSIAGAIVQGALAGIGFAVFGVPQPVTWAALLAVTSFIPVVGVPLVWVPAAVWLAASGRLVHALLLTAWSLLVVGALQDYVIRPRLVGRGTDVHPLLTLVSLLGGISVFGIAGVIVGPVAMSLFLAIARIYERESNALDATAGLTGGTTAAPPPP